MNYSTEVKSDLDVMIDFKYFNQFVRNMIHIAESNKYKFCIENGSWNLNGHKAIICLIFGYCEEKMKF